MTAYFAARRLASSPVISNTLLGIVTILYRRTDKWAWLLYAPSFIAVSRIVSRVFAFVARLSSVFLLVQTITSTNMPHHGIEYRRFLQIRVFLRVLKSMLAFVHVCVCLCVCVVEWRNVPPHTPSSESLWERTMYITLSETGVYWLLRYDINEICGCARQNFSFHQVAEDNVMIGMKP